jgi:hypothetical protein
MQSRILLVMAVACWPFLPACGSAEQPRQDAQAMAPDLGVKDSPLASDKPLAQDAPFVAESASEAATPPRDARDQQDAQFQTDVLDAPAVDGPAPAVDAPTFAVDAAPPTADGGARIDARTIAGPDGASLLLVDYCLPIRALPANGGSLCPATVDLAIVATPSARVLRCSQGPYLYFPNAQSSGSSVSCYYDPASRQLFSIIIASDTASVCSDQPDTASFIHAVYGQSVTCSGLTPLVVDAGSGQ